MDPSRPRWRNVPARSSSAARRARGLVALGLALAAAGCASGPEEPPQSLAAALANEPPPLPPAVDRSLGMYLADLDKAIRAWMDKTWSAVSEQDKQTQDRLELYLESEARYRQQDLLVQLETGPPRNRIIAATALGFTRDPAMLSPLLAALDDPQPEVVQNALIGLSLLQSKDTPLEPLTERMRSSEDARLRGSAAYAVRCLLEIGATGDSAGPAGRDGAVDPDPIVRSQSALILALAHDPDALDALKLLLDDEVGLVASAAAAGLARLGREVDTEKGGCARALTDALEAATEQPRRAMLIRNLIVLGEKNYGTDVEMWSAWSHRLP